ncbi:hypothetical protein [Cohnella silvisoli]|uniref:Uncharacterized protein n=1 Tax=Cohnella silvisoli TaxID=2873699 RepID=A0ABV1KPU9_9BACL|nr:hypothetical protein [Cohnella silvisoli]MCD9022220.1 hypothetical protein [Cohnella silvisoli]
MRRMYPLLIAALLALILAGCGANSNNGGTTDVPNAVPESQSPVASSQGIEPTVTATTSNEASASPSESNPSITKETDTSKVPQAQLKAAAQEVIEYLRERDLKSLAQWIDPEQGLRFSPYSHINKDTDLVFKADKLPAFKDATKLKWGTADGSGEAIELSFRDYYEKFVYNQDYADAPNVNVNKIVGTGNVEFNGKEVYPNASYVEYHFPGFDKELGGMDWQSLVLVFVPGAADDWKLVAIVHGQWTT